ncbi:MAG: D-alanine--D-alanine ligase family protein [bacterium]
MIRVRVAVLMGGPSPEREVSLGSGRQIMAALDPTRYEVLPVEVMQDGQWMLARASPQALASGIVESGPGRAGGVESTGSLRRLARGDAIGIDRVMAQGPIDVALIAMHGPYGEDGTVQGLLELAGVPYTGSGVLASALAMDKLRSRQLCAFNDIPVPATIGVARQRLNDGWEALAAEIASTLGYPCVAKPNALGSSIGVTIVRAPDALRPGIERALEFDDLALIEEYISGTEITGPVLDDPQTGRAAALPLIEIVPKREFFTYEAKYTPGASEEICPARLSRGLTERAQAMALRAHEVLGCRDMSRVDMFVRGEQVIVLEVNTIPGMTEVSLLPQAARAAGISFPTLLDTLITAALRRAGSPAQSGVSEGT